MIFLHLVNIENNIVMYKQNHSMAFINVIPILKMRCPSKKVENYIKFEEISWLLSSIFEYLTNVRALAASLEKSLIDLLMQHLSKVNDKSIIERLEWIFINFLCIVKRQNLKVRIKNHLMFFNDIFVHNEKWNCC